MSNTTSFYKIKFYKVALCSSDPYTGNADPDYSSCFDIFNNSSGKEVIIEPDAEVDLVRWRSFIANWNLSISYSCCFKPYKNKT